MFSRGNISEKIRFSKFSVSNEIIVDMFAGIGYWVLQLSKKKPPAKIYCVDINPNAIEGRALSDLSKMSFRNWFVSIALVKALKSNVRLNKRDESIFEFIQSDCLTANIPEKANRIFLGLIPCCCFTFKRVLQLLDRQSVARVHIHHNYTDTTKESFILGGFLLKSLEFSDKIGVSH